jgi:8-oxo-dGTP diphosphatase
MTEARPTPHLQSAHAILRVNNGYALQLRDNRPDIAAPGTWSLFGGMIQEGETPVETIKREIAEELCIETCFFQPFGFRGYYSDFEGSVIRTWFFVSDVTPPWSGHRLTEGQDGRVFRFDALQALVMPSVMRQVIGDYEAR